MKKYILAEDVGHFGLFSGRKFLNIILPEIYAFTQTFDVHHKPAHKRKTQGTSEQDISNPT